MTSVFLKGHNTQHSGHMGQHFLRNESMIEIFSKSLVRAIGLVLRMKSARAPIKTHKGDEKWPLFVNKQLFWWSTSITLDNNNDVLTDFQPFFSLYTFLHTSVGLTSCISMFFSVCKFLTSMTTMLPVMSL